MSSNIHQFFLYFTTRLTFKRGRYKLIRLLPSRITIDFHRYILAYKYIFVSQISDSVNIMTESCLAPTVSSKSRARHYDDQKDSAETFFDISSERLNLIK